MGERHVRISLQAWGSDFDQFARQMRDMIQDSQKTSYFTSTPPDPWQPRINLYETAASFLVCAELAGVAANEIDVTAANGVLRIRGTRSKPEFPDGAGPCQPDVGVHVLEIDWGAFDREVEIPSDVAIDRISAVCHQGYLWLLLPRESGNQP